MNIQTHWFTIIVDKRRERNLIHIRLALYHDSPPFTGDCTVEFFVFDEVRTEKLIVLLIYIKDILKIWLDWITQRVGYRRCRSSTGP